MKDDSIDTHRTIKCNLKTILKTNEKIKYTYLFDCIHRMNQIAFRSSHFIRAYLLFLFDKNEQLPIINIDFVRMVFKVICKKTRDAKNENKKTYNKLNFYFETEFIKILTTDNHITDFEKYRLNSKNLTFFFKTSATEMVTSYTNNIKLNFFKYVNQYVNQSFIMKSVAPVSKEQYRLFSDEQKIKYNSIRTKDSQQNKIIKQELKYVKEDLLDGTFTSDTKYHKWILEHKENILPKLTNKLTYESDINITSNCWKYLKHMLTMNKLLEKQNKKMFQPICLRTSVSDKYVTIDTSTLKEIFNETNSKITQELLWNTYFNIKPNKFKIKNCSFDYAISTDGISASIRFIKNEKLPAKLKKIENFAKGSILAKQKQLNKTEKEIEDMKLIDNAIKIKNEELSMLKDQEYKKKLKAEFKKKSIEEKTEIKLKKKLKTNKFEYLEDAIKNIDTLNILKAALKLNKIGVVDPGVRSPLTILGHSDKKIKEHLNKQIINIGKLRKQLTMYNYTNGRRLYATKRLKFGRLKDKKTKNTLINGKSMKELESELTKYSGKTIDPVKFADYTRLKLKIKEYVEQNNSYNEYFKTLRWKAYINKRQHEDQLLNEIESLYGKDMIFILGDWGNKGRLKQISVPNAGMKTLLSKRFKVFLIDEYLTSKLYHKTELEGGHFEKQYKIGEKVYKQEIHAILKFKTDTGIEYINRDYNATLNMMKIVKSLIIHQIRPINYQRKKPPKKKPPKIKPISMEEKVKTYEIQKKHDDKLMSLLTSEMSKLEAEIKMVKSLKNIKTLQPISSGVNVREAVSFRDIVISSNYKSRIV